MYENENYSGETTNRGTYFNYTAYPTEELEKNANTSRQQRREQERQERKEAKRETKAARRESKSGRGFRKVVFSMSLGLCFGAFAGLGFYGVMLGTGQLGRNGSGSVVTSTTDQGAADTNQVADTNQIADTNEVIADNAAQKVVYIQNDVSDVVAEVMPAMVSIVNNYTTTAMDFWGQSVQRENASSGSGIIVAKNDEELLIVSNNHVVESATTLQVTFIDGSTAEAVIKGLDSDMDLAVISIPVSSLSQETIDAISVATLGDSSSLRMGEPVIAIGNALGYGQSVTGGFISAIDRELTMEDGTTGTFIQTDAAINPGNSGGALLNMNGEVVGINSNKIGGTAIEGMGYAIPITSASPIIAELMERETRNKVSDEDAGYLGITMQEITDQIIQMYNMPSGVFVYDVAEGSAAEEAGIQKGDIVVKLDGQRVTTREELKNIMQYYSAGETITVSVRRAVGGEYESLDLDVVLGSKPQN